MSEVEVIACLTKCELMLMWFSLKMLKNKTKPFMNTYLVTTTDSFIQ